MSKHISVKGSLYVQDTEDGQTSNNIPFEIYSDYSADPINTYFRQLQFSNVTSGSTYMGVSNVGAYFYISEPSASITEQSNTFIITSGGNIGIGKTDPSDRLHVEGGTLVSGSAGNFTSATVSDNIHASNVRIDDGKLVVTGNQNPRIPSGTIALWENSSIIPNGWILYDDIENRFVRGSTNIGLTSGNSNVTLGNTNFPLHAHTTNSNSNYAASGDHSHNRTFNIDTIIGNHSHTIGYNVTNSRYTDHWHFAQDYGNNSVNNLYELVSGGTSRRFYNSTANFTRDLGNHDHKHNIGPPNNSTTGNAQGNHSHTFNMNINNSRWYHAAYNTTSTNNVPSSNKYDIIPKYKSYVFIIKQ